MRYWGSWARRATRCWRDSALARRALSAQTPSLCGGILQNLQNVKTTGFSAGVRNRMRMPTTAAMMKSREIGCVISHAWIDWLTAGSLCLRLLRILARGSGALEDVEFVEDFGQVLAGGGEGVVKLAHGAAQDFGNFLMTLAFAVGEDQQHLFVFGQPLKCALEVENADQARVEGARVARLPAGAFVVCGARGAERGWGDSQWVAMVSFRPRSRR